MTSQLPTPGKIIMEICHTTQNNHQSTTMTTHRHTNKQHINQTNQSKRGYRRQRTAPLWPARRRKRAVFDRRSSTRSSSMLRSVGIRSVRFVRFGCVGVLTLLFVGFRIAFLSFSVCMCWFRQQTNTKSEGGNSHPSDANAQSIASSCAPALLRY